MKRIYFSALLLVALLVSCSPGGQATLTVMTHDSFSISEDVIKAFEQDNDIKVFFLASGDSGEALNKAILSKNAPIADIFYGVDNTFISRALEAEIFEPYKSPLLADIPDEFQLDPSHGVLPVDFGDVCINYDKTWFMAHDIQIPATLDDLLEPEYKGLLVVENPATSSPGLAFLLATIASYGDPGYLNFWADLRENDLTVVDGWNTAYYTNFSGSSGRGPQPMVLSYASSPAAEVIYADPPVDTAFTASILRPGTCFRQVEFAGILKGTHKRALAERFIDFILGVQFQEDIPLQMFMYPVNSSAKLPPEFVQWAQMSEKPASLDPAQIAANRDEWIAAWTEIVIH